MADSERGRGSLPSEANRTLETVGLSTDNGTKWKTLCFDLCLGRGGCRSCMNEMGEERDSFLNL